MDKLAVDRKHGVGPASIITEANNNLPIVKRSRQAVWALIDLMEIYYHADVRCPDGTGKIISIDKKSNVVVVATKRKTKSYPSKNIKIMIRPLTAIQGKMLNVIATLALGLDGFSYSVKRDGKKISCIGKAYTVEIFIKPEFAIRVFDANGKSMEARNLGYIMAYLTMRSFDLFNLLKTPYALIASGVPNI